MDNNNRADLDFITAILQTVADLDESWRVNCLLVRFQRLLLYVDDNYITK